MDSPGPLREAGSRARLSLLVALVAVAPGLLVTLHGLAIVPLIHQTVVLRDFTHQEGLLYVAALPPRGYSPRTLADTAFEDGRALPWPGMPGWGTVARDGAGRYIVSGDAVYLSTTDHSDPRTNGRTYTVTRPWPVPSAIVRALWLITLLGVAALGVLNLPRLRRLLADPPFWAVAGLLIVAVAANRAWYFLDFPLLAIHPDSGSYYAVAEQIGTGAWPNFGNRPPMYPLFLKGVFALWDRALAVAVGQTALSLLGAVLLVRGAYRWSPALGFPAAGVMALYLFGFTTMEHDTAMLSESLYAAFLMLGFAALLLGVRGQSVGWLAWSSAAMAFAILTRPAGMFLLVTYAIVMAWLVWRRFAWRHVVAFALPLPLLMISMSAYNMRVVQVFAPSTWGEANLAVATFCYWQTDPAYPPEINADIVRIQGIIAGRYSLTGKDPSVLDHSWDPDVLSPIFVESFNAAALDVAQMMGGGHYETVGRQWIRQIAFDSIQKRPHVYVKFVWAMLYNYFKPAPDYDFRVYLQNRAWMFYVVRHFSPERGNEFMVRLGKEFATGSPPPAVLVTNTDPDVQMDLGERVLIMPTRAWRIYELTHVMRVRFFEYWAWSAAVLAGVLVSCWALVRSRFRNDAAFMLFIISISAVGASLVVSLVEYSQPRYSYPMEWAYGLCAVLLALVLFVRPAPVRP